MNPIHLTDGYKVDHRSQYPEGTTLVYANLTPRKSRMSGVEKVVFFGLQYAIKKYLIEEFNRNFFQVPKAQVVAKYKRRIEAYLGAGAITYEHIEALHDLGYMPLEIRALPEGTRVPMRVPMFTIHNTIPEFFWLTNYLETLLSAAIWLPCTSATTAAEYRRMIDNYTELTGSDPAFVDWQGHDFSFRGMGGVEAALLSGAAHLLSFAGTDSIPSIDFLEEYYNADAENELIGGSVPATEHSVMCMGTQADEIGTFRRLIEKVYPKGIVSIVSDTWDFWQVITEFIPELKPIILKREGKVVIRPDSGDPVHIICGDPNAAPGSPEHKGAVECLWDTFGGSITAKGFKLLDPHIGVIYGDSITLERCKAICDHLIAKGFSTGNIVFGIGSYTYQYVTRDTFGFAMKATYGEVNGVGRAIFKEPKTDDGTKRSARGLLRVDCNEQGELILTDNCTWEESKGGLMELVFLDGKMVKEMDFKTVKDRLKQEQKK
jgi:nicotinamide phosphoribosyltransferase